MLNMNKFSIVAEPSIDWTDELKLRVGALYSAGKSQSTIAKEMSEYLGSEVSTSSIASAIRRAKRDGLITPREKKVPKPKPIAIGRSNVPNRGVVVRRRPHPKPKGAPVVRSHAQNLEMAKEARKNYGRQATSFDPDRECDLLGLNDDTCRWPLGSIDAQPPYRFCGCITRKPSVYCAGHLNVSVDAARGPLRRQYEDVRS